MFETSDGRFVEIETKSWWDTKSTTLVDDAAVERYRRENPTVKLTVATKTKQDWVVHKRQARLEEIIEARAEGKSYAKIGEALGISAGRVTVLFKVNEMRTKAKQNPRHGDELSTRAFKIVADLLKGKKWTPPDIAAIDLEALRVSPGCGPKTFQEIAHYVVTTRAEIINENSLPLTEGNVSPPTISRR